MLRRLILFPLACCTVYAALAQTTNLREAVERAIEQSVVVQQGQLALRGDEITLRQNSMARYPRLSFQTNGGVQFGLNVDPTTNDLVQQRTSFISPSLDGGISIYQGGRIKQSIRQSEAQIASSEAQVESLEQDVALSVAQTYLETLLAEESVTQTQSRLTNAEAVLSRVTRLIEAGNLAPVEQYEPDSEVARQRQSLVQAQNQLELSRLRLRQLMRLPAEEILNLVDPSSIDFDAVTLPDVAGLELYQAAVQRQPAIRAARLAEEAAKLGIDVAKTGYYPTLSAFGRLDTRYSSQAKQPIATSEVTVNEQTVFINEMPVTVGFPQPVFGVEDISIGTQFRDFFGQVVGLQLSVPILNNGTTKLAVERAQLALEQSQLASEQERQTLEIEVEQAYQQALAGQATVIASERAVEAAQAAFDAAERRTELGASTAFDLTNAQLLLEQAENALLQARYQFLFNAKVLDFYLGRPLTLN